MMISNLDLCDSHSVFFDEIGVTNKDLANLDDYPNHCYEALYKAVCIPSREIQIKIWLYTILTPSSLSVSLPRILCYGDSSTGKSSITKTAIALRGLPRKAIRAGKTTGTSFRNDITAIKYGDDFIAKSIKGEIEDKPQEKDCLIVQDDINSKLVIDDPVLLSILKSGIDRTTSILSIANAGTGTNLEFDIFGLFVFSSCDALWQNQELFELKRRLIILYFKKYDFFSEKDKEENLHPDQLIDLDWYDFTNYRAYDYFWSDERRKKYLTLVKSKWLRQILKAVDLPTNFCKLYRNLIATAYFIENNYKIEYDCDIFEAVISIFYRYYINIYRKLIETKSPLEMWIEDFLKEKEIQDKQMKDANLFTKDFPIEIPCKIFNDSITKAHREGGFYQSLNKKDVSRIMRSHGYIQTRNYDPNDSSKRYMVWQKRI